MTRPEVVFVVAMGENRAIGRGGALPWRLPADLAHFKALTLHRPVVMGRKTFASIGRPLPERTNVVLSRSAGAIPGCVVVRSVAEAFAAAGEATELMVIGGAEIYRLFWPLVDRIELTRVRAAFDADAFFPAIDPAEWEEVARRERPADDRNPHDLAFCTLRRRPPAPS